MRPAVVRFYFDADVLGLAHTICRLRNDCTYPGDPGARQVTISGDEGTSTWNQLEIVMRHWRRIESLLAERGPFIYTATRSRFARVDLH